VVSWILEVFVMGRCRVETPWDGDAKTLYEDARNTLDEIEVMLRDEDGVGPSRRLIWLRLREMGVVMRSRGPRGVGKSYAEMVMARLACGGDARLIGKRWGVSRRQVEGLYRRERVSLG